MVEPRFSAGLWLFGGAIDRFCTSGYQELASLETQIERAGQVSGLSAIECHQTDFDNFSIDDFKQLLGEHHLVCTNVNTNVWGEAKWAHGAFTHRDPDIRRQAIEQGKRSVAVARELGCPSMGLWLGSDGYDYPFQVDYRKHWDYLLEGVAQVAEEAAPDIKVGVEYKPKEPRTHMSIGSVGKALWLCSELGRDNVGVVVDFGHALMNQENPADSVALLMRSGKLFNVHFNDAYGYWDDDMIPGVIHFWETLEMLYYCREMGYDGWFGLDMFPFRENGVKAAEMAVNNLTSLWRMLDQISPEELSQAQESMDAIATQQVVRKIIY